MNEIDEAYRRELDHPAVVEKRTEIVHVATGELIHPEDAPAVTLYLKDLRTLKDRIQDEIRFAESLVLAESERQGTKTLHFDGKLTAKVTGGPESFWDIEGLRERLTELGLPEDRMKDLITETVSYKVNANVAKQLASANEKYAEAIEASKSIVEKPYRVSVS